jgi:serine phosphatase RsbU (regulator of sigma subunit)
LNREKNEIIVENHEQLKQQSDEITDSINYAKRIQEKILGRESILESYFDEHFILYKPKDIISGDFYWFEELEDHLYIGLGDCTGHGVPGALVSMVCHNALRNSVREGMRGPEKILNRSREHIIEKLVDDESTLQDGMDIGLYAFEKKEGDITTAQFSGANNPTWIIRKDEIIEVKGDKQPVGYYEFSKDFSSHSLELHSGDILILLSDGYPDQFGGPKSKKYSSRRLKTF